ncbi:MAG: DUF92 domain-containing protein, partial [Chloroflexota bacterium]
SAGVLGSFVDSVLGDLVQEKRMSAERRVFVEGSSYQGERTLYAAGIRWVDNDVVNLSCTATGALIAAAAGRLVRAR